MTIESQQDEKRRVLANDLPLRSGGAYLDHVEQSPGGRFSAVGAQTIVGQSPNPYPPLPDTSPWHGEDPVGQEPGLGYRINDIEHSAAVACAEAPGRHYHAETRL
jgi:hypothetical protein